jgi:hypothetical protein
LHQHVVNPIKRYGYVGDGRKAMLLLKDKVGQGGAGPPPHVERLIQRLIQRLSDGSYLTALYVVSWLLSVV